jgi:hypothetical protein
MHISQVLNTLGTKRVIWIDDRFNTAADQLATLLTNSIEIAQSCGIQELADAFAKYEFDATGAVQEITQILTDLGPRRNEEIRAVFFATEKAKMEFPTNELSVDAITKACQLLGVADGDKWTFERAAQELRDLCAAGDSSISYIIDLNESGGSPTRGLDMLRILWEGSSQGTAFILTHETDISKEAQTELELREQLLQELDGLGLPVCVIAKERLSDKADDEEAMAEALRVGVKRAGLRRNMHHVLNRARDALRSAIDSAALNLLTIPPEQLEAHIFERGYKEGVSELHVVERAITAHFGKEARAFFGIDDQVQASLQCLRALRAISLQKFATEPEPQLAAFREAEVWESETLLNKALTPIACGDVFEVDNDEASTNGSKKKFILLGQPCDISLRPEEKRRAQDTAFLVPLKSKALSAKAESSPKEPLLPFTFGKEQWACDFRNASVARLSILDLASFRQDGRVRVDDGHEAPTELLTAQQKAYDERTKPVTNALHNPDLRPPTGQVSVTMQLTFTTADPFKYIHSPIFLDASEQRINGETISRPKRATWRLRRCGPHFWTSTPVL